MHVRRHCCRSRAGRHCNSERAESNVQARNESLASRPTFWKVSTMILSAMHARIPTAGVLGFFGSLDVHPEADRESPSRFHTTRRSAPMLLSQWAIDALHRDRETSDAHAPNMRLRRFRLFRRAD